MYMAETVVSKKLKLKPGMQAAVLNAPQGYVEVLGMPFDTGLSEKPDGSFDFVQIFVKSLAEAEKLVPQAVKKLKHDGLFWLSYPKGNAKVKTDLNRDILWKAMDKFNLAGVFMVAVDDTWSAMRFRPADMVGR